MLQSVASKISRTLGRESRVVKALRPGYESLLEITTRGRGFVREFNGRERFYVDPRYRGYFPETYEPAVCDFLRAHIKPGAVSLNIGAHVGIYAMCMAEWSKPNGRVFAFEPNPPTRSVLANHVMRNALAARVEIISQAISDVPGEATFYAAEIAGFNRLGQPNPVRQETHSPIQVQLTTVDGFCETRGISPDWLLMDIEGYEIAALNGALETIKSRRRHLGIIVELHPFLWKSAGASRVQLESVLADLRLRILPLTGQVDPLAENGVVLLAYT